MSQVTYAHSAQPEDLPDAGLRQRARYWARDQYLWVVDDTRRRVTRHLRVAATLPAACFAAAAAAAAILGNHEYAKLVFVLVCVALAGLVLIHVQGRWAADSSIRGLCALVQAANCRVELADDRRLQASRSDQAWREVARHLAHEIKNPLTPIRLSADELLEASGRGDADLADAAARAARTIARSSDQALALISRFSTCARPRRKVERELHFLDEVLQDVVETYRSTGLRVDLVADPIGYPVMVDLVGIRQVLANLLQNARDAGARRVLVSASLSEDRRYAVARVSDDGPGIPEDQRARVFDPYFTTRSEQGGTGLGLAIAHQVTEDHGGRVGVGDSCLGGVMLQVEIPIWHQVVP